MLDVEKLLEQIGPFGIWHAWVYFWLFYHTFFGGALNLCIVFIEEIPDFMCENPLTTLTNWTFDQIRSVSTPKQDVGDKFDGCKYYLRNYSQMANLSFSEGKILLDNDSVETESCSSGSHIWHTTGMKLSIVNQWNLVCSQAFQVSNTATVYMVGYFAGCLVASFLADKYGRKKVFIAANFLEGLTGVIQPFVPNLYGFLVLRTLLAFFGSLVAPTAYVLASRVNFGIHQRVSNFTLRLIPESPRWLVSQGRENEAVKILQQAARWNKKKCSALELTVELQVQHSQLEETPEPEFAESTNFFLVFKHWVLALRTINICFNWIANSFVYYGISYLVTSFSGNIFVNNAIAGALEAPAYILCYLMLLWARKKSLMILLLFAGVSCLLYLAVPDGIIWAQLLLVFVGKLAITASFSLIYLVTSELYPTPIRGASVALCSMFGRIGSIAAPWVVLIAQKNKSLLWVAMTIFGGVSIAAGVLTFFLPESQNQPLPDTLEEAIHQKKDSCRTGKFAASLKTMS